MGELPGGRDASRVPEDWDQMLDPTQWQLGEDGLPWRQAARVLLLRRGPQCSVLLVAGHDFADPSHRWVFTPGGGLDRDEDVRAGALRELAEETGIVLRPDDLVGPVLLRSALLEFRLLTARQEETFFLAELGPGEGEVDRSGWTRSEREVLDALGWWTLDELDAAAAQGVTVYPEVLPGLLRRLAQGWDGQVTRLCEVPGAAPATTSVAGECTA